ncbi:MAG TPA: hypothetical protein VG076_10020 [Acidimicrobiales bacterium]|jgi:hypothetical protein|nr:hypothetical protein [Acidimicrobiales bacterium]
MSATPSDPPIDDQAARRHTRLASSVRELRTRAGGADMARVLLTLGAVLMPLGVVLILLGWSGVSHTTDTFEQTPYVVSGGLLGLALVVAGGFCYFGYWQTKVARAVRRDAADIHSIRESLQHIEELLAANPALTGNGATPKSASSTARRKRSAAGT